MRIGGRISGGYDRRFHSSYVGGCGVCAQPLAIHRPTAVVLRCRQPTERWVAVGGSSHKVSAPFIYWVNVQRGRTFGMSVIWT